MSLVFAVICSELLLPWPLDGGYSLVTKQKRLFTEDFSTYAHWSSTNSGTLS